MELNNLNSAAPIQKLPRPDAVPASAAAAPDALTAPQELHKLQGDGLQSSIGKDFDAVGDYDELPTLAGNGDAEVHALQQHILNGEIDVLQQRVTDLNAQMDQIRQNHATIDLYDPDGKHLRAELEPLEAERDQAQAQLDKDRIRLAELQGATGGFEKPIVDPGFNLPYEPDTGHDLTRNVADPGGKSGPDFLLDAK